MTAAIECEKLVDEYVRWLKAGVSARSIGDVCQVTAPFLDRHNDYVQFYVQRLDGQYRLTDDGQTIQDLEQGGVDLNSPTRSRHFQAILNGVGVRREGDELVVMATPADLGRRQHAMVQAILAVNDMFVTARPLVASLFQEDVEQYLVTHDVRFTPNITFNGQSGFVHHFDFVVPASKEQPERILKAINQPSRDQITSLLFAWNDTRRARPQGSKAYAVLNDEEKRPPGAVVAALREYGVTPVLWSQRGACVPELAA